MADGIPFVPLDCHFDDDKIPMIEAEFGLEGFAIVVKLFQKIYGGLGYYCEWNDRVALLFAKQIGAGGNVVQEVVSASIREGIFDKGMFEKFGVLTSHGIQKRFLKVAKRRKQFFKRPEYVLVCVADFSEDGDNSAENVCNSGKNASNSGTSKVKGSKGKLSECKGSEAAASPAAPLPDRNSLIQKYGENAVSRYELKYRNWQQRKGFTGAVSYPKIAEWLLADGVPEHKDDDSLMDEVRRQYMEDTSAD